MSRVRTTHPLPTTHPLIAQPAGWVLFSKPNPTRSRVGLGLLGKTRPNPLGILGRVGWVFVGYPPSLLISKAEFTWGLRLEAA